MKKKKVKLGLNKTEISNLSMVKGGNGNGSNVAGCVETISRNFIDLCCRFIDSAECGTADTDLTTCYANTSQQRHLCTAREHCTGA